MYSNEDVDKLLAEGLVHYFEAIYTVRQFERTINDMALIIENEMENTLLLFGQEQFTGNHSIDSPGIDQIRNYSPDDYYAWVGRNYWIAEGGGCKFYIGIAFEKGKQFADVCFQPQRAPIRSWLTQVLEREIGTIVKENDGNSLSVRNELEEKDFSSQGILDAMRKVYNQVADAIKNAGGWLKPQD